MNSGFLCPTPPVRFSRALRAWRLGRENASLPVAVVDASWAARHRLSLPAPPGSSARRWREGSPSREPPCARWCGPAARASTSTGSTWSSSRGDLRDARSVRAAMAGIRHVFHVAADYRLWARDPSEIYAANVDGTRNVMQEALRAGVERIVYTSSVATLGLRADGSPADESVAVVGRARDRRLQAQQDRRRAAGRGHGRRRQAARGHRQSLDADRPAGREAHADRPHHRRGGARPHARLRRYRAQLRPCR